ncbi:ParA family protein [Mammaliicoccus vitulinus]|uniref:ParA family protein n=1 Tax=Mammaliicoccus vitulinus TaxID=71237 RepID=UPI001950EE1F|nr:ParA family protein [Mammaliicoccus vitulinus]MBM6630332.1 ParA family protein [Mammaliicoccus vitulinus]
MAYVSIVSSEKGGQGKSSILLQMAGYAGKTKKVLCLELDIQKNLTLILQNTEPRYTIYDVLNSSVSTKEAIMPSVFKGIDYIPGSRKLKGMNVDTTRLTSILDEVQSEYDLIFIDCPANINSLVESAYTMADLVITPMEMELFALSNVTELIETVQSHNSRAEIVLVPNKVGGRSKLNRTVREHLDEMVKHYDNVKIGTELPSSIIISNLLSEGKLLINAMRFNPLKDKLKELYKELYK